MNEENVKIKQVLPFLLRLGFKESELRFEESYTLQFGRNRITVNDEESSVSHARAFLDILVSRGGNNLFLVEVKRANHALTPDDVAQATSYARVVFPPPPFTLLTNGKDWQILDTLTAKEIPSAGFKIQGRYELVLPAAVRDAAFQFLIGYSEHNLLSFCRAQVGTQMKPLVGSATDLPKKFIPELTAPRFGLAAELRSFEASDRPGCLVLADSGQGKTSALCEFTLNRLAEGKPTLFFPGASLEAGLLAAITAEFNWTFSEELTPTALIRRVSPLIKTAPLVIVVDAIDEWSYAQKGPALLALLRAVQANRIKIVFSCKTSVWEEVSQPYGSDIGFLDVLHLTKGANGDPRPVLLAPLTDEEFRYAVSRYREVFEFRGAFEEPVLKESRANPFLLRVIFVVASGSGQRHLTFSSAEFFERYLSLILKKCGVRNASIAQTQLVGIARLMFEKNAERVSDSDVRRALSLPATDGLLPALFEQNILQQSGGQIAFYFQHLRSYLLAFKVLDWPARSGRQIAAVGRTGVQMETLAFYFRYATAGQMEEIVGPVWGNVRQYLHEFQKLVAQYVAPLDRQLTPGDGPLVGFIAGYLVHSRQMGVYGFRRRQASDPEVLLLPLEKMDEPSRLFAIHGAKSLHYSSITNGFWGLDARKIALEHEVLKRVAGLLENRQLIIEGCPKIAEEALIAALWSDRRTFAEFQVATNYTHSLAFPLQIDSVRLAIRREKLRTHFEHVVHEEKKAKRFRDTGSSGGYAELRSNLTKEDRERIETEIAHVLSTGTEPQLQAIVTNLRDLEAQLDRAGVFRGLQTVHSSPWPTSYGLQKALAADWEDGVRKVKAHVVRLFEEFLRTYQAVIDANFPALKDRFPLRALMPVTLYLLIEPDPRERHQITGRIMRWHESKVTGENEVILCADADIEVQQSGRAFYRGRQITVARSHGYNLEDFMYSLGDSLLTEMVYRQLIKEWQTVSHRILEAEGFVTRPIPWHYAKGDIVH